MINLQTPIDQDILKQLKAGDIVNLSGIIFTGRDAAHKRLCEMIDSKEPLPFDLHNATIYYVGPTPTKPGQVIGAAGPTSSYRMDAYTEPLLQNGLKIMIGKGGRSDNFKKLLKKYGAVYLSAIGGTAALISKSILSSEIVAFEDLQTEAIRKMKVRDFFAIVTYDCYGGDLFKSGMQKFKNL